MSAASQDCLNILRNCETSFRILRCHLQKDVLLETSKWEEMFQILVGDGITHGQSTTDEGSLAIWNGGLSKEHRKPG